MNTFGAQFKPKLIAASICVILGSIPWSYAQEEKKEKEDEKSNDKVVVTGSRIKRTDAEGSSPVTTITQKDMIQQGFKNVTDVLRSLTSQTSQMIDETMQGTYTPNAAELNLRSLGPGRTLVLINGHRIADYPMPYNGQSSFVNLNTIPFHLVQQIDILTGGASAIYGSDAIAGVINVITKNTLEGIRAEISYGQDTLGNGDDRRFTISGGHTTSDLNLLFSVEHKRVEPLTAMDRPFHDSPYDTADPNANYLVQSSINVMDPANFWYSLYDREELDGFCAQNDEMFVVDRGQWGYGCGTWERQYNQLRMQREETHYYLRGEYMFTHDLEAFFQTIYSDMESQGNRSAFTFIAPWASGFRDVNTGETGAGWRWFSPDEIGKPRKFEESQLTVTTGLKGVFSNEYEWETTYHLSQADFFDTYPAVLPLDEGAWQVFHPNSVGYDGAVLLVEDYDPANIYRTLTPDEINQIFGDNDYTASAQTQSFSAQLSGDLFSTDAGEAKFAAVLEYANQEYAINPHERTLNGGWAFITGTGGGGERDRFATGLEVVIPFHKTLEMDIALRWDKYDDITQVDDALTYGLGLSYRPTDNLLVRTKYATNFRAPDMHFVFADKSGNFGSVKDEWMTYRCENPELGTPDQISEAQFTQVCDNYSANNQSVIHNGVEIDVEGDPTLKEETGHSFTFGFVYQPIENLNLTLDYYKIRLEDEVKDMNTGAIMMLEKECREGERDIDSAECQNTLSRISRGSIDPSAPNTLPLAVEHIQNGFINRATRETDGADFSVDYTHSFERGDLILRGNYTRVFSHKIADEANEPLLELIDDIRFSERDYNWYASAVWQADNYWLTLYRMTQGPIPDGNPNPDERKMESPWTRYNVSAGLQWDGNHSLTFQVNNLTNAMPPKDPYVRDWPFYRQGFYNTMGRTFTLTYGIQF